MNTFIHVCTYYPLWVYVSMFYIYIYIGIRSVIYYACLNTIKYYTVQVTNLYTDANDSQNNHNQVY